MQLPTKIADDLGTADKAAAPKYALTPPRRALSDAPFRHAFLQAAVALSIVDFNGQYLHVNPCFCAMLGYDEAELISRDVFSITHPDDLELTVEWFRHFDADGYKTAHFQKRYLQKSGREIHVSLNISLARDASGQPLYFITHAQDDTQRRRAEWLEQDRRLALEMVAQDRPLPAVLNQLVRMVERQMPEISICMMLLQDGTIRPFGTRVPPTLAEAIARKPVSFAAELTHSVSNNGAVPLVAVVEKDPAWEGLRDEARQDGVQCCWAVTVRGNDGVPLGLLIAFSRESRPPTTPECDVLETAMRLATITIEHHQTTRQLAHLVRHDPLTGLPNRVLFEDRLQQALATARRNNRPLGLLALDLNRFKRVNDTLGHQVGDALLQHFAVRLRNKLRESDTLARVGGDEFLAILPEVASRDEAEVVARRLIDALAAPFELGGQSLMVTSSMGLAMFPQDADDAMPLQRAADAAMYRAKEAGHQSEVAMSVVKSA